MTQIHIGAEQFRRQLTDLLNRTRYGQDHIIVERHGTPLGALIPYDLYEALMATSIPERLAQLAQLQESEEITDLAVALEAILENESRSYPMATERQSPSEAIDKLAVREVAQAYFTSQGATDLSMNNTLTLEEAAMYLKLPIDTIAQQADQGMLPGRKINDTWRFLRAAVDNWLRNSDGRQILLQQVGAFADDESLAALRAEIYAERGRPEVDATEAEA